MHVLSNCWRVFMGGMLLFNTLILVIVDLITSITCFPKAREDPAQYIHGRDTDKNIFNQLKEHFGLQCDGHAYQIDSSNSQAMCINTRILASKGFRGNRLVQCNSGVVACAQKCAEGVQMNWSLFLLNQLLEYVLATQTG